ncbi:MAG: HAMP domain-containing histidine kinase [Candidatus Kuenenia sp.]|nr:HAMP domain-containing histidine kinase [Candidatus Kuenenia hertensis]
MLYSATFWEYFHINVIGVKQRRLIEKEFLLAKKLQTMGVITTLVAHEFNSVLGIIDGKIQLLMQENKDKETLVEELRLIRNIIKDGAEIVHHMNKFTKIRKDRCCYVTIDLLDIIKKTLDLTIPKWKDRAKREGITYSMNLDDVKHTSGIKGNPLEVREVLINIINNAIDAMPEGGTLSFSTWEEGENVILSISDTGLGMDEETQSNIFDPFFTTKEEGTGLGMSIVLGIVKRHGGKIEVQSQKGKGSTFILSFPASKEFPK